MTKQYEFKIKHKQSGKICNIISIGSTRKEIETEFKDDRDFELVKGSIKHYDVKAYND